MAIETHQLYDRLPSITEINSRLVENAREKRLLVQMKKMAEQREKLKEAQQAGDNE